MDLGRRHVLSRVVMPRPPAYLPASLKTHGYVGERMQAPWGGLAQARHTQRTGG
jgi:hypothetical protein